MNKTVDSIQQRLTEYACGLNYDTLPTEVIHAAKVRTIDTFGSLIAGFFAEPCRISRNIASKVAVPSGTTIIGTRMKTTPDLAAFVNASTSRYGEITDAYHSFGSANGHPSDVIMPVLAAAEYSQSNGREFITAVVLAYEIYVRFSDIFHNRDFDPTNFSCVGTAVATGKLMGLSSSQLSHCISMAIVPNVILRQVRTGHLSMFKAVASGQAGRAGVFAGLLAQAGMEGPHLPFEGKAGWCDHVARERFSLDSMGSSSVPFKILNTQIKMRPSAGASLAPILAAEKVAPLKNISEVKSVTVEVYKGAKESQGSTEYSWNPQSKETADHSIPYVVAATLMDGTITLRSFNDSHLMNLELRGLIKKMKVIENEDFTQAYRRSPMEHRARVTVVTNGGEQLVGETGGGEDDLAAPKSDTMIEEKFRGFTEDVLGAARVNSILNSLWHLDDIKNVADIPSAFVLF